MGMDAGQTEVLRQQLVSFYNKVVLFVAVDGIPRNFQVAGLAGREVVVHELNLQCVSKGNGIKYGFEIVIAILAFGCNVKAKVNLGAGKCQHIRTRY